MPEDGKDVLSSRPGRFTKQIMMTYPMDVFVDGKLRVPRREKSLCVRKEGPRLDDLAAIGRCSDLALSANVSFDLGFG